MKTMMPFHMLACATLMLLASVALPAQQDETSPDGDEFLIGVADVLRIEVWKNPDLGGTVPVRPDGMISLPLVGEIAAKGMSIRALQRVLTGRFSEFVTAPAVSVVVEEINSRRIFITGEVRSPGVYDLVQPTRVMQALATAGGWTEFAKKDKIIVLRELAPGLTEQIRVSVTGIVTGRRPESNILLVPGDTIIVP